ncbi:uncharacterized protein EDB91DRAFT_1095136, partial [Suillus paluster]|uniref:uncharacterized protein n=1 Tax=Suillus paluster TaxID=48578 RepID=UPI001B87045D
MSVHVCLSCSLWCFGFRPFLDAFRTFFVVARDSESGPPRREVSGHHSSSSSLSSFMYVWTEGLETMTIMFSVRYTRAGIIVASISRMNIFEHPQGLKLKLWSSCSTLSHPVGS